MFVSQLPDPTLLEPPVLVLVIYPGEEVRDGGEFVLAECPVQHVSGRLPPANVPEVLRQLADHFEASHRAAMS